MLVGKVDAVLVDRMRAHVTDAMAPILSAVSQPVATVASSIDNLRDLTAIRDDNIRLREENTRLLQWQTAARKLMAENRSLQGLLNFVPEEKATFISARVIADSGGVFSHTLVLNAGETDGVKSGQAVLSDHGFVGRVAEVGNHTARVLLLTDLNSRIPVVIESNRARAILAGNNTARPRLIHLMPGAVVTPSDRIVTSGHGGAFPAGLPVGTVAAVTSGGVEIQPFIDRSKLEFVRAVDFGTPAKLPRMENGRSSRPAPGAK
jgi:rod shape-determining protein MreC